MSKEKQIEEMAKVMCNPTANKGNCEKCEFKKQCSKFDDAADLYNAGYRKQSEWISVEERLPNPKERVIICYNDGFMTDDSIPFDEDVTHWMPFPEAPKMKGGAE